MRDSEARFRQLLEYVPNVSVQGYGLDLTTRYWNQASERLYGYSAKEAIGRNLLDLIIPTEMHAGVVGAVTEMIESGLPIPAADLTLAPQGRHAGGGVFQPRVPEHSRAASPSSIASTLT